MRAIFITGYDWNIDELRKRNWPLQQWFWTDNGRLSSNRYDPSQWFDFYHQMADIAKIDVIAPTLRSTNDTDGIVALNAMIEAIRSYNGDGAPTLAPFFDTGALSDVVSVPGDRVIFDACNQDHLEELYIRVFRDFYQRVDENNPRLMREKTKRGRLLVTWWGIRGSWDKPVGNEVVNWAEAQRILDYVSNRLVEDGFGEADHIVDTSWPTDIHAYGRHAWFDPWVTPPEAYSVHTYRGVTTGVAVPGFRIYDDPKPFIDRRNGETLRQAFRAFRRGNCEYVLLESSTNTSESAMFVKCEPGYQESWEPIDLYLQIVRDREHC